MTPVEDGGHCRLGPRDPSWAHEVVVVATCGLCDHVCSSESASVDRVE